MIAADKHSHGSDDLIVSSELYVTQPTSYLKAENQHLRPPVPEKSSRRRSISCKRLVNRRCSTPLRELSPACVNTKAIVPYVPHKVKKVELNVIFFIFYIICILKTNNSVTKLITFQD